MTWTEIVSNPSLQNLPFKLETNQWSQIVMSPVTPIHARLAFRIGVMIEQHLNGGECMSECPVETSRGVRVPDMSWASRELIASQTQDAPFSIAPEICVEVISPSNTDEEMLEKRELYLARGAKEVWTCDLEGHMNFYAHAGKLEHSEMVPGFPLEIQL
jgi:Uma2 family endonuclease